MQPVGSGPDARTYTILSTAEQREALYAALMGDWYRRPSSWCRPLALGVLGVALLLGGPVPWVYGVLVGLGMSVLLFLLAWRRFEHSVQAVLDRGWFEGSEHEAVFDDEGMTFRGPVGAVEYRWLVVDHVRPEADVVAIHLRPGKVRQYIPVALFPAEEIAEVRRRLGSQHG